MILREQEVLISSVQQLRLLEQVDLIENQMHKQSNIWYNYWLNVCNF